MTALEAPSRREQILSTAAELFAARGFHGVSVADLGSACGISGPALYKHFASKDAVLAEMLVSISEQLLAVGRDRVAGADDPGAALEALVDWHVRFALDHRALIVVQDRDWESLPRQAREMRSGRSSGSTSTSGPPSCGSSTPTARSRPPGPRPTRPSA